MSTTTPEYKFGDGGVEQLKLGDALKDRMKIGEAFYDVEPRDSQFEKAIEHYNAAISQGNVQALINLAELYLIGVHTYIEGSPKSLWKKDEKEAVRLYQLAIAKGSAEAMVGLGDFWRKVEPYSSANQEKALALYRQAAELGNPLGQVALGHIYTFGMGDMGNLLQPDPKEQFRFFKLAADQGYKHAQYLLGDCYQYGTGVEENLKEAMNLYELAAKQGHVNAMIDLGGCYEDMGNQTTARQWYELAVNTGYEAAARCLERHKRVYGDILSVNSSGVQDDEVKKSQLFGSSHSSQMPAEPLPQSSSLTSSPYSYSSSASSSSSSLNTLARYRGHNLYEKKLGPISKAPVRKPSSTSTPFNMFSHSSSSISGDSQAAIIPANTVNSSTNQTNSSSSSSSSSSTSNRQSDEFTLKMG